MSRAGPRRVVVAGGGPAGAALAIRLRRHDVSVTMCDAGGPTAKRVGERLGQLGTAPLRHLNVWTQFLADGHQPSAGVVSVWGADTPTVADTLNPFTAAWHVDRPRFDRMLLEAAVSAGATVLRDTRVARAERTASETWTLDLDTRHVLEQCEAEFIVDATGRGGRDLLGRSRASAAQDRLVGIASVFRVPLLAPYPHWTLVEACRSGWWYSAPLPEGESSVIFFSDPDLLPRGPADLLRLAVETGACCTAERIPRVAPSSVTRMPAWTGLFQTTGASHWVPIGDAAIACDPLSGGGLARALETGIAAADAIAASFGGDQASLSGYADGLARSFRSDLASRQRLYSSEQRWPTAPFWSRRAFKAVARVVQRVGR